SARRRERMPPRLPILASRAPREPQRPPDGPRARAEAAGVAAEASSPRAGSDAAGGRRGRRDRRPPQLPRAPAAHGGTRRPTERAWSEDREPGAAPPPTARTALSLHERLAGCALADLRHGSPHLEITNPG